MIFFRVNQKISINNKIKNFFFFNYLLYFNGKLMEDS